MKEKIAEIIFRRYIDEIHDSEGAANEIMAMLNESKNTSDSQPIKAVMEFAEWCSENNDMLYEKGHDVIGCVKEWENTI